MNAGNESDHQSCGSKMSIQLDFTQKFYLFSFFEKKAKENVLCDLNAAARQIGCVRYIPVTLAWLDRLAKTIKPIMAMR